MIAVTFIHENENGFEFYGTSGRNTGLLAYFSFSVIMLSSTVVADSKFIRKISIVAIGLASLLSIYGVLQSRSIDIFVYADIGMSKSFGTFGNANFQSAFLGIVATLSFSMAFFMKLSSRSRILLLAVSLLMLIGIQFSSAQGFFCTGIGLMVSTMIWLLGKKRYRQVGFVLAFVLIGLSTTILGFFNLGPLSKFVFNPSIEVRGFYWNAAYKIISENPFFGVGMDGYGDFYRRFRSLAATQYNPSLTANSSHNILLDIGAGGGIILMLLYLGIMGLALVSILRVCRRNTQFDPYFAAIAGAWIGYQAQSFISINHIGVGIWGWTLTGLLIGYEINTRQPIEKVASGRLKTVARSNQISSGLMLSIFLSGILGLVISLPPYIAGNKFYQAIQTRDPNSLVSAANLKPYDRDRFLFTAQILAANKLDFDAIKILKKATVLYPDYFELWQVWSRVEKATPEQISRAKAELKRLDPSNPDWR
jgi:O-antigen ligase